MLNIEGKTLITSDWHWGLKNNQVSRLRLLVDITNKIVKFSNENKIKNIIFCGDWMHSRTNCSVQTLNVAYKCLEKLSKNTKFYFIVGNHDIFMKESCDINSAVLFKDIKNVTIISQMTECTINGKKAMLCPWLYDFSKFKKSEFDMLLGHFDISTDYLFASYVESNIKKNLTNPEITELLNDDEFLNDSGLGDLDFEVENIKETFVNHKESSELIGDWVEVVKPRGVIFSGHIHQHKEFYTKERKFVFVGSPYQQTRGESESEDGFYTLSEKNEIEFHKIDGIPVHIDLYMDKIAKDIDGFDFSIVKGNIVHRVYKKEIDRVIEAKIIQKICDNNPYEELAPDYDIMVSQDKNENPLLTESLDSIRKSKMEYIHNYINNIDDKVIIDRNIDRNKLIGIMQEFYERVSE